MRTTTRGFRFAAGRQSGLSIMEVLISMSISLVVTAAMVTLMINSLNNTSRVVNMTKLSDDMRSSLQMMTRDVRRTSYNANAFMCYGNPDCFSDGSVTVPGDIVISAANDCFTFLLDRDHDGDSTSATDPAGGFRRMNAGGVGALEMWVGDNQPNCAAPAGSADWLAVSNPASMDVTLFDIDDDLSYTQVLFDDGVKTISQRVRKLRFTIQAELVNNAGVSRHVEDVITVRNDLLQENVAL